VRRPTLPLAAALAAVVAVAAAVVPRGATRAQEAASTVYVSGLRVGPGARAFVRVRNVAPSSSVRFLVRYTVRAASAGQALSEPGAGSGSAVLVGRTLELELGPIVDAYRRTLDLGPYAGPVQFVAYAETAFGTPFSPQSVVVEADQTEGGSRSEAVVEWR
jgi:hypothetical protein